MPPIDLLPDLKVRQREQLISSLPRLLLTALLIWILVLGGLYAWVYLQRQAVQTQLADIEQQIQALEPVAERVQQANLLTGQVSDLQNLVTADTTSVMVPLLDLIATLMPTQISAQHVSIADGQVSLSCSSSYLVAIGRFHTNLEQTAGVHDLLFSAINSSQTTSTDGTAQTTWTGYTFSVTFRYGGD